MLENILKKLKENGEEIALKAGLATYIIMTFAALRQAHAEQLGNVTYHLAGLLAGVAYIFADYMSTLPSIEIVNTNEFKRSGLQGQFYETSPITGRHPTVQQFNRRYAPMAAIIAAGSALIPPIGLGVLIFSPLTYTNNKLAERNLRDCLSGKQRVASLQPSTPFPKSS